MTFDGTEAMRILAIGAHPDDIEAGCGGALVKYAQNGHRVFLMVMTEGEQGGAGEIRKFEQEQAAKRLRAERIFWGGYQDTAVPMGRRSQWGATSVRKMAMPRLMGMAMIRAMRELTRVP